MYLLRNYLKLPASLRHCVVTIGNFDGVHIGHQHILRELKSRAIKLASPCGVILFEPQPQEFFQENPPARLSTLRQKYRAIKQQGIDFIMVLRFNNKLAQMSAEDFIQQVLYHQLHIEEIWVGQDFHFGHQRQGDIHLLKKWGPHYGYQVHCMPDITLGSVRISSTQIRHLLLEGELHQARKLLGHFYTMIGRVIKGDARGRILDMRTANIKPPHKTVPLKGIFVVRVELDNQEWPAVASIGTRPVFSGHIFLLEVHIFNFSANIYGKRLQVEFLHKLRDEENFDSIELLKAQMQQDLIDAKNYWKQHYDEL